MVHQYCTRCDFIQCRFCGGLNCFEGIFVTSNKVLRIYFCDILFHIKVDRNRAICSLIALPLICHQWNDTFIYSASDVWDGFFNEVPPSTVYRLNVSKCAVFLSYPNKTTKGIHQRCFSCQYNETQKRYGKRKKTIQIRYMPWRLVAASIAGKQLMFVECKHMPFEEHLLRPKLIFLSPPARTFNALFVILQPGQGALCWIKSSRVEEI